ncbi:hypothetical protein N7466_011086 [Penicillium verhagenii]|uniref:uncharacterized protein n=1 Tax=Penicillium verhagenii TaxID=1562060 RepID=UPI00254565E3|nr:uncharacterized protein N7466_011086 [Penicillium verhagenii]KAJ5917532.1 hypothetical protein N7466_011086 [Penicillium verhagenii]
MRNWRGSARHELIRVQEQIRRKDELCAQLEAKATASEDQHHQELTGLCGKINALENDLEVVNEEECIREWRRLRLHLDQWVKRNFKDIAKLSQVDYSAILQSIGITATHTKSLLAGNSHQRWAIIQAWIIKMLNDSIFLQYCPGLAENENEFLVSLDRLIFHRSTGVLLSRNKSFTKRYLGSFNTWRHCKSGINTALGTLTEPSQGMLAEQLVNDVESMLGEYASTTPKVRQQRLYDLFSQCVDFKMMCNRQPEIYEFVSSPSGNTFDTTCMIVAGDIDCCETTVALSLWQSLWKEGHSGNLYCLEPELVWSNFR